jgi:hypothetical protein
MSKHNRTPKAAAPMSLRAQSRALFPNQSRAFRAQWVLARMRLKRHQWHAPIGVRFQQNDAPDFLRALPRNDPAPLTIEPTWRDRVRYITKGQHHG